MKDDNNAATLKAAPGGVTEAMVERGLAAWRKTSPSSSGIPEVTAILEAALSAEPAAQVEDERVADLSATLTSALKLVDHQRRQIEALTAPPAQPAECVPEGMAYQVRALSDRSLGEAGWMAIDRDGMFKHPSHFDYRTLASPAPSDGGKGVGRG